MPKITIENVAELAGVSIKTVSRVVNREPNVRESTREKVEKAVARLNYRPNQSARSLASHRARFIGLVYDDPSTYAIPSSGYVIKMQEGVLRACKMSHYELLIHPCNYRSRTVAAELRALMEQARPSGIVLAAPLSNMPKIVRAIAGTGTPFVALSPGKASSRQAAVATNDRETSAEMTQYLASLGHRRIAFITGHPSHKAVANRFLGYRDGLTASGLKYAENLVSAGLNSIGSGEECALALLGRKQRPTAIFAANDDMAAGVMRAASRLGLRIPDDLSVAGCDDIALAQQLYPELTTIRQPLAAMAERASDLLIAAPGRATIAPGTEIIPGELCIRQSTAPPPA